MDIAADTKQLTSNFTAALVEILSLSLKSGEDFLIRVGSRESLGLADDFIAFIQNSNENSLRILTLRLKNILATFSIFRYLNKINYKDLLILEKNILTFEKKLLDYSTHENKDQSNFKKEDLVIRRVAKSKVINTRRSISSFEGIKKDIKERIAASGEMLNSELFKKFPSVSRRTMKRHLSNLITGGHILRRTEGKKVFYRIGT